VIICNVQVSKEEEQMKVKATNVSGAQNITANKVYAVVEEKPGSYVIKNDANRNGSYQKYRFEVVSEVVAAVAPASFKSGQKFEDHDGEVFMIVTEAKFAALVSMKDGTIINGFHPVHDVNHISLDEMKVIDNEWADEPLTVIEG
jgi:hypothetical protein